AANDAVAAALVEHARPGRVRRVAHAVLAAAERDALGDLVVEEVHVPLAAAVADGDVDVVDQDAIAADDDVLERLAVVADLDRRGDGGRVRARLGEEVVLQGDVLEDVPGAAVDPDVEDGAVVEVRVADGDVEAAPEREALLVLAIH